MRFGWESCVAACLLMMYKCCHDGGMALKQLTVSEPRTLQW